MNKFKIDFDAVPAEAVALQIIETAINNIGKDAFNIDAMKARAYQTMVMQKDATPADVPPLKVFDFAVNYINNNSAFPIYYANGHCAIYNGHRWQRMQIDTFAQIKKLFLINIHTLLYANGKEKGTGIDTLLKSITIITYDRLPINTVGNEGTYISFNNCVLHIHLSGNQLVFDTLPHAPQLPCFVSVNADFNTAMIKQAAITPTIDAVIKQAITPTQRNGNAFAALLAFPILKLAGVPLQWMPLLIGGAAAGKSTILNAIASMFDGGVYYGSLCDVCGNDVKRAAADGHLLFVDDDLQNRNLQSDVFNKWSTGAKLDCRSLYMMPRTMIPVPTVCASNNLPQSYNNAGLARRWYVINIERSAARIEGNIAEALKAEAGNLFALACLSAKMMFEQYKYNVCDYSNFNDDDANAAAIDMQYNSDAIVGFWQRNKRTLIDKAGEDLNSKILEADIEDEYNRYNKETGGKNRKFDALAFRKISAEVFIFKRNKGINRPAHYVLNRAALEQLEAAAANDDGAKLAKVIHLPTADPSAPTPADVQTSAKAANYDWYADPFIPGADCSEAGADPF